MLISVLSQVLFLQLFDSSGIFFLLNKKQCSVGLREQTEKVGAVGGRFCKIRKNHWGTFPLGEGPGEGRELKPSEPREAQRYQGITWPYALIL